MIRCIIDCCVVFQMCFMPKLLVQTVKWSHVYKAVHRTHDAIPCLGRSYYAYSFTAAFIDCKPAMWLVAILMWSSIHFSADSQSFVSDCGVSFSFCRIPTLAFYTRAQKVRITMMIVMMMMMMMIMKCFTTVKPA